MQYRIAVFFAVAAVAVPLGLNTDGNAVQPRSDENSNGDVGLGLNLLSNGDSTGVKNAKRDDEDLITDYANLASDIAKDFAKRGSEDSAGDVGLGLNLLSNGDSTGVRNARRSEDSDASLVGPIDADLPVKVGV
ncbi:uncharacterized protein N7483_001685 [Penicillium malachiteum]|uniref:uncharacterized protein n=1 Tax=Penicillium malachiteum TaxID=1324776 RepID=UPI002547A1B3|nr:uncharacterized protein N7483_001685 [Penicillium malachiteum]KAJ5736560.1 hypothetical protein N7483_001685 [Penicillium malachiteum]